MKSNTILQFANLEVLDKIKNISIDLNNLYNKRKFETSLNDIDINKLKEEVLFQSNKNYEFISTHNKLFVLFKSFKNEDNVLVIYNKNDICLDIVNLLCSKIISKYPLLKTTKIEQILHLFDKYNHMDFIIVNNSYHNEINIYLYNSFNLLLYANINLNQNTLSNQNLVLKNQPNILLCFHLNMENFIIQFNFEKLKIKIIDFSGKIISSSLSFLNKTKYTNGFLTKKIINKYYFYSWFNECISCYELNIQNNKSSLIKNIRNYPSINKMINYVSHCISNEDNNIYLIEFNSNFFLIRDFFSGKNINKIEIPTTFYGISQSIYMNNSTFIVGANNGKLIKFNIINYKIDIFNLNFNELFIFDIILFNGKSSILLFFTSGKISILNN